MMNVRIGLARVAALGAAMLVTSANAAVPEADLILANGEIYTAAGWAKAGCIWPSSSAALWRRATPAISTLS